MQDHQLLNKQKKDKWTDSEVQGLLSLHPMEEIYFFDASMWEIKILIKLNGFFLFIT